VVQAALLLVLLVVAVEEQAYKYWQEQCLSWLLVAVAVHGEQVFHPHSMKHVVVLVADLMDKRQTEVMVELEVVKAVQVAEDH
jgi:hypothetical protein